jgi:polyphosphate kinase
MAGKGAKRRAVPEQPVSGDGQRPERLPRKLYEAELSRLQAELVRLQEWVRFEGERVVVVFEGRDAAGKGSTIKRVTEFLKSAGRPDRRASRTN